jgi:hypothetical protein
MLRPASWLALLSRTFTFELSLTGSPQANVEYNYVDKQSISTTGLSPASPTALWAAELGLTPRSSDDGTMDTSERDLTEEHLKGCETCRSKLDALKTAVANDAKRHGRAPKPTVPARDRRPRRT